MPNHSCKTNPDLDVPNQCEVRFQAVIGRFYYQEGDYGTNPIMPLRYPLHPRQQRPLGALT